MNRRTLLQSAAMLAAQSPSTRAAGTPDWNKVRADFPWIASNPWITAADYHPMGTHTLKAAEKYLHYRVHGPGPGRSPFTGDEQRETKEMFGKLINANPSELAFVHNTTDGENLVVAGIDWTKGRPNVVIDDLHYQASKFLYRMLAKEGRFELRIVRRRPGLPWRITPEDMDKAIDKNTRLVSMALVSNINGFVHDAKTTAAIAHSRGAIVYADIIQGAGNVPMDMKALGIDTASCGTYKWLMADRGFGFLYVREDLQDLVVRRSRYGVRQYSSVNGAQTDAGFRLVPGAARYEASGSFSAGAGLAVHASMGYIHALGVDTINARTRTLAARIHKEVPKLGYPTITPEGNPSAVVSFITPDYEKAQAKIKKAYGGKTVVAFRRWEFTSDKGENELVNGMRISPSIYNNDADIDRLLNALA